MYRRFLVFICKVLIKVLRLAGKNGSALPGLVIERLYPSFLTKSLASVEKQIILVTGTNGKTTTTKMLVDGLRGSGARVVTNTTGSNMTRGLISALIEDMTYLGSIKPTDWFVFEMDEAYAPRFTENISPRLLIGLNVLRDQLDRYGEIDITANFIKQAAMNCDLFVYNSLDPLMVNTADELRAKGGQVTSFGAVQHLLEKVSNEQSTQGVGLEVEPVRPDVVLLDVGVSGNNQSLTIEWGGGGEDDRYQFTIPVQGFHNALNVTAAAAAMISLDSDNVARQLDAIGKMPIPFGRGEQLHFGGKVITVALVKNPSGFTTNLDTFVSRSKPDAVLFVVNDKLADGRDVSWLWDVDFTSKITDDMKLFTSGVRAYDMALRLKQDGFATETDSSVPAMIQMLMKSDYNNVVIIPTYTALFEVRSALSKYGEVPRIW